MNAIAAHAAPLEAETVLSFALVNNAKNTSTTPQPLPWGDWCARLTCFAIRADKDGPGFIPAVLNGPRKAENLEHYTALVLDIEAQGDATPPPPEEAAQRLQAAGLAGVVYTSHNHMAPPELNNGKPAAPRYRVVVPLAQPMPPTVPHLQTNMQALAARLALLACTDTGSKDRSRLFYLPSHREGAPHFAQAVPGDWWQPLAPMETAQPPRPTAAPVGSSTAAAVDAGTLERVKAALPLWDPDDYHEWVKVGMALHSSNHPDAYALWCAWGAKSPKYSAHDHAAKWASFNGNRLDAVTVGSIIAGPTPSAWPDPQPLQTRLHPVQALNRAMLPTDLHNYIYDQAERIPMVPDMVAVSVLVALGSVLGARVAIKPKRMDDFAVVANLWGGFIAPPSSNKSAAFTAGLKPIDKLVAEAITAHQAALAEHQASQIKAQASAKALKSRLDKAAKAGDSEGMDAIIAAMQEDDSEAAPILRRYKTHDSSPEALAELEASNPNGILVCRDELTGLLANLDREGNGEARAFYLESWNGTAPYEIDRIMRGHSFIENHCLSILGGIQPDKLIAYLTPAIRGLGNDGLIQRFQLLVYPDPIAWQYVDRAPDKTARDVVYDLFARIDRLHEGDLIRLGAHPSDDYNKRPFFRFSDAAQAHYVDWLTRLHTQKLAHEPQPILCEHLSKYQKLMPALALLFHIVETINDDQGGAVSLRAAEMASDWCEYLESHARRVYGLVLDNAQIAAGVLAQKILQMGQKRTDKTDLTPDWLESGFTASMVLRKNWKGLTDIETIHAAMDLLADHHWLRIVQGGTGERGGRPSQTAHINRKIFNMAQNRTDKTDLTP